MMIAKEADTEPGGDGATPISQLLVPLDYEQAVALCRELAEYHG